MALARDATRQVGVPVQRTLHEEKWTMDYSLVLAAYAVINTMENESHSALPDAPIVASRRTGYAHRRLVPLQGWLASVLHQVAWAIEPAPRTVLETRE